MSDHESQDSNVDNGEERPTVDVVPPPQDLQDIESVSDNEELNDEIDDQDGNPDEQMPNWNLNKEQAHLLMSLFSPDPFKSLLPEHDRQNIWSSYKRLPSLLRSVPRGDVVITMSQEAKRLDKLLS